MALVDHVVADMDPVVDLTAQVGILSTERFVLGPHPFAALHQRRARAILNDHVNGVAG